MSKPIVLIAEELSPATVAELGPDFEIRQCDGANRSELLSAIVDADAILVRSATKVDAEAIAAAKKLRVVARAGVGLDNVDVKAATQAGVMVVNAPTSNIVSAAELAVALLLASARNVAAANSSLKNGEWKRSKFTGVELADKVVGVVGLGRIGVLVAQRLAAFGVQLISYDPYVQPSRAAQLGIRMVSLDELLEQSDFITIHLPKTAETKGLISDEALKKVKPTVHIINAARGGIVDEAALAQAIIEKRVAGAGIDVFETEPCTDSPLFALDSVVVTPHLGASTDEAQEKAGIAVAKSVRLALAGELVPDAVNIKGGHIPEDVKPYMALAENLGEVAVAVAAAPISAVEVVVFGELSESDTKVLELSALKGALAGLVHDPVSYVNAPVIAGERGIVTTLISQVESPDHRSLVQVRLALSNGASTTVSGTVTGPKMVEKIVEVNGFDVDLPIRDHMAFFQYSDRPGVIGIVGRLLGEASINVAEMQVGRAAAGENALMALTVDTSIPAAVIDTIVNETGADTGRAVDLV